MILLIFFWVLSETVKLSLNKVFFIFLFRIVYILRRVYLEEGIVLGVHLLLFLGPFKMINSGILLTYQRLPKGHFEPVSPLQGHILVTEYL